MASNCSHPTCFDSETCRRTPKTPKARQPLRRTPIKPVVTKKSGNDDELKQWFLDRRSEMTGKCLNCGDYSCAGSFLYWKWSVCHIFPKSPNSGFPSVATHPDNWIELCSTCHTLFDRSLSVAATMKVWLIAVSKFRQFESEITETHKYLTLFKDYARRIE